MGARPLATARVQIVAWLNQRPDGSEYLTIDVAGLARFHANVLKGGSQDAPFATGKGVTVWRNHARDHPERVYYRIKCNRFKEPFSVFPADYPPGRPHERPAPTNAP